MNPATGVGRYHPHIRITTQEVSLKEFTRFILLIVAAITSLLFMGFFIGSDDTAAYICAIIAVVALGAVILLEHAEHERDRRLRECRRAQWERRDAEARW